MSNMKLTRGRSEAEDLIGIIKASDMHKLSQKDLDFLAKVFLKLKYSNQDFSDKEVFYLRDIKERCL